MGGFLARTISEFLKKFLNQEIPDDEFIFRRVSLNQFINGKPKHRLALVRGIFRNEYGDGMSVDWERICQDPSITQTREGGDPNKYGVVVLSIFDMKNSNEHSFEVISDQIRYPAHCLVKRIPMSLSELKKKKRNEFDQLSEEERSSRDSLLMAIREFLCKNAFWVITLRSPKLKEPPLDSSYSDNFTEKIRELFSTRGHQIPT